jgi:hypothetical protein
VSRTRGTAASLPLSFMFAAAAFDLL